MNYDNTNRGAIWPNKDKTSENQPDYKGSANLKGEEFWISAWKRKPGANPKAPPLNFVFQPKEAVHSQGMQQVQHAQQGADVPVDDDLPF